MAFLEVEGYAKNFGNSRVLRGISFSMEKGEVLAVIGSSGGGKTTLLRCLNFLETPDSGILKLDGEQFEVGNMHGICKESMRRLRLQFGMVFQHFNLFPQYTALENVALAKKLLCRQQLVDMKKQIAVQLKKESGLKKRQLKQTFSEQYRQLRDDLQREWTVSAEQWLARVGMSDKKDCYPYQLSGGQQQRVAIARALILQPSVLCFDEPTSALDPELTGEVLKVIRSLKSSDRTMIIVTHEMQFALNVADNVLFLSEGVAEEYGRASEVLLNPKSDKLRAFLQKTA